MSILIEFPPQLEDWLNAQAARHGLPTSEFLRKIVQERRDSVAPTVDETNRVLDMIAQWQEEDGTPVLSPTETRTGESPSGALFRLWADEDSRLTPKEIEADKQLWVDFQHGINEERRACGRGPAF